MSETTVGMASSAENGEYHDWTRGRRYYFLTLLLRTWRALLSSNLTMRSPSQKRCFVSGKCSPQTYRAPPSPTPIISAILTSVFSFADAAALLDWDLEAEVIPFARFMIYLKKAKVSSVVHPKLLGIYAPPVTLATPLNTLARQFESTFPPTTPSFYTIFAAVSSCQQAFSYFVPSLDHMPLWREILLFFLKNDALVMLHLHFRIIVTGDIKQSVYATHQRKIEARKFRAALRHGIEDRGRTRALPNWTRAQKGSPLYEEELMPVPQQVSDHEVLRKSEVESVARKEHEYSSPKFMYRRGARGIAWSEDEPRRSSDDEPADVEGPQEYDEEDVEPDIEIPEDMTMSFINEPREVTGIERLWLEEIALQRPALKDEFLE